MGFWLLLTRTAMSTVLATSQKNKKRCRLSNTFLESKLYF